MKKCCIKGNSAFTLIELLVVVLIIGILAAVALPQYQKAVAKSRFATLKPIAKSIKDAQELYFDTHGHYATESELDDLDIDIPENVNIDLSETDGHDYVRLYHTNLDTNNYTMYLAHSDSFANNIYCEADDSVDKAKELCVAEHGQDNNLVNSAGYRMYLLSGNSTGGISSGPKIIGKTANNSGSATYRYADGSRVVISYTSVYVYDADNQLIANGAFNSHPSIPSTRPDEWNSTCYACYNYEGYTSNTQTFCDFFPEICEYNNIL